MIKSQTTVSETLRKLLIAFKSSKLNACAHKLIPKTMKIVTKALSHEVDSKYNLKVI